MHSFYSIISISIVIDSIERDLLPIIESRIVNLGLHALLVAMQRTLVMKWFSLEKLVWINIENNNWKQYHD